VHRFYLVSAALHLPLAMVISAAGAAVGFRVPWPAAIAVALAPCLLLPGRIHLAFHDRPISEVRRWLVEAPFHVHLAAILLAALLWVPVALVTLGAGLFTARPFDSGDTYVTSWLAGLVLAAWGVIVRPRRALVREVVVPVVGLGRELDGFRIAQLSDLHLGSLCPRGRVEGWVRRVNALDVDLVALTGDYVTSGVRFHDDIAAALGGLRAREGVLAVMGNHDYYGDGEPLMTLLQAGGVRLLRNEHRVIERDGARLCVAGVDDLYTRRGDVARALAGRDPETPLLALAHDPRSFPALARGGAALTLSGHTHWGQVALPFFAQRVNFARLLGPRTAGLHVLGEARLWVSPGLGATGLPLRLGAGPEITVVELRAA
jgi:uncharacterized protein